jgi:ribosome-associated translation inhibitor RaiA
MEKIDKLYEQLENFQYVLAKMRDEGFDYCFRHYSSFEEVKDEKFHSLRESYIKIAEELEEYVESKINQIQDKIQEEI